MGRFHSLRINNIRKETADTVSFSLDIPADLKEDYAFIPGQYVTFRTNISLKKRFVDHILFALHQILGNYELRSNK